MSVQPDLISELIMILLLFYSLSLIYLLIARRLFSAWLAIFRQYPSVSLRARAGYTVFLILSAIFWPLVIPFAYLELLRNQKKVNNYCDVCAKHLTATDYLQND